MMAESLVDSKKTVVKNEDNKQSTTLDKEIEIASQKDELSKSESDSATCESILKDDITESNVVRTPDDSGGEKNEDREQTSQGLNKEEPTVNLDQEESKELQDNNTTTTAAEASSEEATMSNGAGDKECDEQTQEHKNKKPSKDEVNIEYKSTDNTNYDENKEKNVGEENFEATHHDKTSASEKLEDQRETQNDVKISNDKETDEKKNVEKDALQEIENDENKDSEKLKDPGTGVETMTDENSDTISTTIEQLTTNPGDKSHEVARKEENRADNKDAEKPTEITNEQGKDDTNHDLKAGTQIEYQGDSASENKNKSGVIEGKITLEDSNYPNISSVSTEETVISASPAKTEEDENSRKENGDGKDVSSSDNERSVENNDVTEVPVDVEPSKDGAATGTDCVATKEKSEVEENICKNNGEVKEECDGDNERSVEDNDVIEAQMDVKPSKNDTKTETSKENGEKVKTDGSAEIAGEGGDGESNETQDGGKVGRRDQEIEAEQVELENTEKLGIENKDQEIESKIKPKSSEIDSQELCPTVITSDDTGKFDQGKSTETEVVDVNKETTAVTTDIPENKESQDIDKVVDADSSETPLATLDESNDKIITDDSSKFDTTAGLEDDNKIPEQNAVTQTTSQLQATAIIGTSEDKDGKEEDGNIGVSVDRNEGEDEGIIGVYEDSSKQNVGELEDEVFETQTAEEFNLEYGDEETMKQSEDGRITHEKSTKADDEKDVFPSTGTSDSGTDSGTTVAAESKEQGDDATSSEEISTIPEETELTKEEPCTKISQDITLASSAPPTEQSKQSLEGKIVKKNTSTSGDPLAVLGVSIETKQKTEPKPKKLKSESKCDVSATKTQELPTPATAQSQNTMALEIVEKQADSAKTDNEENRKEEDFVMIEHQDAEMERSHESDQFPVCQESKSEEDLGDNVREEEKPEEKKASHITTAAPAVAAEKLVVEITAEFLELMEGFCMAASQEFPSDIIDFAARYFQRIYRRRSALRKYNIEVSDLALLSDVNWVGNI